MMLIRTTLLLLTVALVASCGTLKPTAKLTSANYTQTVDGGDTKEQPQFLDIKPIKSAKVITAAIPSGTANVAIATLALTATVQEKAASAPKKQVSKNANVDAESFSMLQLKYAIVLDITAEELTNTALYQAIEEWYGTRYRFGGTTKRGVDCSSLMQHIYTSSYGKQIPRTAVTQYRATQRINQDELKEGDLIFFHTTRSGISHVGLYLGNRRFVHASSSRGVVISNLDESYYAKAYRGSGRFADTYTFSE